MRSIILCLLLLQSSISSAQSAIEDVHKSHIEANVPPDESFDAFLRRDLLAYFRVPNSKEIPSLGYQLLRDGPTQSGISYPKYYVWVQIRFGPSLLKEGAVRLAAIDRVRFEVAEFLSREEIVAAPERVSSVFPAALVPSVLSLAGAK